MADTHQIAPGSGAHAVLFYEDDAELVSTVSRYLSDGLSAGERAIIIATESHRRALEAELRADGIDTCDAVRDGDLVSVDAQATLNTLIDDGRVDERAFRRSVGRLLSGARDAGRPVRVYGEMVALLWSAGAVAAAVGVETLWNEVAGDLPVNVLCAYEASAASRPEHAEALQRVCDAHSSVSGRPPAPRRKLAATAAPAVGAERPLADEPRGPLALQISNAIGRLHKQFVGRGPTKVHTHIDGDLVVCLLEGGLTPAERAVRAHAGDAGVMEMRAHVQAAMRQAIADAVEAIVGRSVRSSMSANDPGEDVQVEVIMLRASNAEGAAARARD